MELLQSETFAGLLRVKLQQRLVGQSMVLEATPSLSLPHAYIPGYFPAPDRDTADPLLRDVPQRIRARAAAGFDVEASLWQCVNVTLASIGPQLQT
ncbi:hypothetical protein O9K51_03614 [Purpureocillium lavendulum]|uniref:Uncharacterized protein n=1 Tax=Purpureocillium lavendulum TaxID=1247861 RepID=A0AB34G1R8_9HYPO|nr:hypothetical protein O9K51_03614 [Purpureocillium lavendulum]